MTNKQWKEAWLRVADSIDTGRDRYLCPSFRVATDYRDNISYELGRYAGVGMMGFGMSEPWFKKDSPSTKNIRLLNACLFSNMTVAEFDEVCQ